MIINNENYNSTNVNRNLKELLHKNFEKLTVVTHNGIFHADDVICVALLKYEYGYRKINVIRTRDRKYIEKAQFVLDVFGENGDIVTGNQVILDHHFSEDKYPNSIPMAACGKLAEVIYGYKHPEFLKRLKEYLLYAVEAQDNGFKISPNHKKLGKYSKPITEFIDLMNLSWEKDKFSEAQDNRFNTAVNMTVNLIKSIADRINAEEMAARMIRKVISGIKPGDKYVIMPQYIAGWEYNLCNYNKKHNNELKLVIFKAGETYMLQVIPTQGFEGCTESHIKLPASWLDFKPKGNIFVHKALFLAGFETEEDAVNAAESIL